MLSTPSSVRYTVEDLVILRDGLTCILKEHPANEVIKKVKSALDVIIQKRAPEHAKKYICTDDCANYTGEGYNASIYEAPLSSLPKMRIYAGYLGKAIVDWRLLLNK
jgi:hypothetical protein